jgi:A/G-specific adenine glycosylase
LVRIPSTARVHARESGALAEALLSWFSRARRDLPWREEPRDPYRTWVSEVMLQQTRVDVVVPYYLRFLSRFPTLRALAEAPLDDVLAHWGGLGYYARARNLHRAARATVEQFGGALPGSSAALATLPGFGPYTAAAVASLAFGEDVALVDGNVARVLARVLLLPGDPTQARAAAWPAARGLLPPGRAGAFNEALMELGATVCTPRAPSCGACPLAPACAAHARGNPEAWPGAKPRKPRPVITWAAVALRRDDGAVLLARRPAGALFEGMWDLPSAEVPKPAGGAVGEAAVGEAAAGEAAARKAAAQALGRLVAGARTRPGRRTRVAALPALSRTPPALVAQTLTHRGMRVLVFTARAKGTASAEGRALVARAQVPASGGDRLNLRTRAPQPRPPRRAPRRPPRRSCSAFPSS